MSKRASKHTASSRGTAGRRRIILPTPLRVAIAVVVVGAALSIFSLVIKPLFLVVPSPSSCLTIRDQFADVAKRGYPFKFVELQDHPCNGPSKRFDAGAFAYNSIFWATPGMLLVGAAETMRRRK